MGLLFKLFHNYVLTIPVSNCRSTTDKPNENWAMTPTNLASLCLIWNKMFKGSKNLWYGVSTIGSSIHGQLIYQSRILILVLWAFCTYGSSSLLLQSICSGVLLWISSVTSEKDYWSHFLQAINDGISIIQIMYIVGPDCVMWCKVTPHVRMLEIWGSLFSLSWLNGHSWPYFFESWIHSNLIVSWIIIDKMQRAVCVKIMWKLL